MVDILSWRIQVNKDVEQFMKRAHTILVEANFPPDKVEIKIQTKQVGIARDILKESGRDIGVDRQMYLAQSIYPQEETLEVSNERYDALVVGRTGVSKLKDVAIGSIANKLVATTPHIPIAVVGGHPETEKVIIGFDGSENAMRAVNCVGELIGNPLREVMLCHVIRPLNIHLGIKKIFYPAEEIKWVESNIKEIEPLMDKAARRLVEGGFSQDHVHKEIQTGRKSRAKGICSRAAADGYGTIALGRRGLTKVEEFFIGRVSTKVLHMAEEMAVWII
jgi:nucleotide-binding universal stress UspA family protein